MSQTFWKCLLVIGISLLTSLTLGTSRSTLAERRADEFQRFGYWCERRESLTSDARHTVEVLLEVAGTLECDRADEILTNLTELDLKSRQIVNLEPLSTLTNLTRLDLRGNQIVKVKPLADLTNLTWLHLNGNQIVKVKPLSALVNLTELYLGGNRIVKVKPLSTLVNLTHLDLQGNQITDVTPLSTLVNLRELYLSNNQITDVRSLSTLTQLRRFYLLNNPFRYRVCPLRDVRKCQFELEEEPRYRHFPFGF